MPFLTPLQMQSIGLNWNYSRSGAESFKEEPGEGPYSDFRDVPFDSDLFFAFFPEFNPEGVADPQYPLAFVAAAAKEAAMFVKPSWCRELDGDDRLYCFFLTVAHLCVLRKQEQSGLVGTSTPGHGATASMDTMPGVMTSASVGGVSVSKTGQMQPRGFWDAWYYQTPYGRKLLAFLEQQVSAGFIYEGEENIGMLLRE